MGNGALDLGFDYPIHALNGGLLITATPIVHPVRIIDSHELILVRSGTLGIFEGDREYELSPGHALILEPGIRHGGTAPYPKDLSFYWLHFRLAPTALRPGERPDFKLGIPKTARFADATRVTELIHSFLDIQQGSDRSPLVLSHLLMLILHELVRNSQGHVQENGTAIQLAERVDAFIAVHSHEPISASVIARALRYNPDYLERVYRRAAKKSVTQAINERRIKESRSMLLMPENRNINDIAYACGFNDPGYFRRVFKKLMELTPKAYRSLNAHVHVNTR